MIWNYFTVYNLVIGNRMLNAIGRAYIFEPDSRTVCEIIYNPYDKGVIGNLFSKKTHKIDEIAGAIYKVKPHVI